MGLTGPLENHGVLRRALGCFMGQNMGRCTSEPDARRSFMCMGGVSGGSSCTKMSIALCCRVLQMREGVYIG